MSQSMSQDPLQDPLTTLSAHAWPVTRLDEALTALSRVYGIEAVVATQPVAMADAEGWEDITIAQWVETLAQQLGLEAEPVHAPYATLPQLLSNAAPALIQLPSVEEGNPPLFLALRTQGKKGVGLLGPDAIIYWVAPQLIQDALCARLVAPYITGKDSPLGTLLTSNTIPAHRRDRVQRALLAEILGAHAIQGCWLLRLSPGAPLRKHLLTLQIPMLARQFIGGFLAQLLLGLLAWWMIGRGTLIGHFEWGWLWGWALLLVTAIPFQWYTERAQGRLAIDLGAFFKQRLLYGALQLPPEAVRREGAGHFLGRVLASEAIEQLALGGGLLALLALLQIGIAGVVLSLGAGGALHTLLLLFWIIIALGLGWRHFRHSQRWDETHRALTNDLVERMVGHRTRLAQEDRAHWHEAEDAALQEYLHQLQRADQTGGWFKALIVRGWLVTGLGWLILLLLEQPVANTALAISLGGVLLARQALSSIVLGVQSLVAALLAWREVAPLFAAATHAAPMPTGALLPPPSPVSPNAKGQTLLTLRGLEFRYRPGGRVILQNCDLQIQHGDRILLEGPSGGGKSTLAALLTGLQTPNQGLLLLNGLDRQTMGIDAWRRSVVTAPQFHENHVLTGTLAFNLLMGRRWPPQLGDLYEAETVCRELGLGELLDRMPSGLQQIVGESGWQLSHGERSRLYIARALLQQADLVILDESFAALDPLSLEHALRAVLARVRTVLVIAHP